MPLKMSCIPSVAAYYKDKEILITGATGFVGMPVIEMLLRLCPELKMIYAVVRGKKGKSVDERKKVFFEDPLFGELLNQNPNAFDKLTLIEGDMLLPGFGISEASKKKIENVSVLFHSAAVIRFDSPFQEAILGHVRATRDLLELATGLKNLKSFMYVSTAYCNLDNGDLTHILSRKLEEKLYPDMDDYKKLIKIAETYDSHTLDILMKHYTRFALNTYLYTKGIAENVCKAYETRLPIVIFRPSIVTAKITEPCMGWVNNLNGPFGLAVATSMGITRCLFTTHFSSMDAVPVDMSAAGMVVAACKRDLIDKETSVYNAYAGKSTVAELMKQTENMLYEIPLPNTIWHRRVTETTCKYNFFIQSILFHMIPAIIIDMGLKLAGQKPRLQKAQQKIHKAQKALRYFMTNHFHVWSYNYAKLGEYLNDVDKKNFPTSLKLVTKDRLLYFKRCLFHVRRYVLKEPDHTLPAHSKRNIYLFYLDRAAYTLFFTVLVHKLIDFLF